MSEMVYQIGPMKFVLRAKEEGLLRVPSDARRAFIAMEASPSLRPAAAALVLAVESGVPSRPAAMPFFESGGNWAIWRDQDAGFLVMSGYAHRSCAREACWFSSDYSRPARLVVAPDAVESLLTYPLDQVLAWGLLGPCDGVLLHAAAVVRDGIGYVLAGRSGAGKSTLAQLCYAAGWKILNDDRVIVHRDGTTGQWLVSGTPWHGTGRFVENQTVPLQGIYMLEQHHQDRGIIMAPRTACHALLEVAGIAWFQPDWSQAALDVLVRLTQAVPVVQFQFTRSETAVNALGMEVAA